MNSDLVKWFAIPCGGPAQEKCDPVLRLSQAQIETKARALDPLGGFEQLTAATKDGAPEQIWINYGATVSAIRQKTVNCFPTSVPGRIFAGRLDGCRVADELRVSIGSALRS